MLIRTLAAVFLVLAGTVSQAQDLAALRSRLEGILALDQKHRGSNRARPWDEVAAEQEAIDRANLANVEALVRTHGWPRRSEVGDDAAMAAFLVIQHADVATQERHLPALERRFAEGEAKGAWLALLSDRILVGKGQRQRYGTQFRFNPASGTTEPVEIEDPERVNERRAALGMQPMKQREDDGAKR